MVRAQRRTRDIAFPTGGLNRDLAFRSQPPYTTPNCQNMRPDGTAEGRERGGSRPGVGKAYYEQLGSGAPVRMLNTVTSIQTDGSAQIADDFSGNSLGSAWSTASWIGTAPALIDAKYTAASELTTVGAVRATVSPFDDTVEYRIRMFIANYQDGHHGTYSVFARMDNTTIF